MSWRFKILAGLESEASEIDRELDGMRSPLSSLLLSCLAELIEQIANLDLGCSYCRVE